MRDVLNGVLNSRTDASGLFSAFPATQRTPAEQAVFIATGIDPVINYAYEPGNVKRYGARGDGSDDTAAIQRAISTIHSYDPTATTQNGNDFTYLGQQPTIFFPAGKYLIFSTINASFRNNFRICGDQQYGSWIQWTGGSPGNNTMFNLECSNYVEMDHLNLDGGFKASCGIYCAGNGTAAVGAKGNCTGNKFHHLFFYNQPGDLSPIVTDFPDQYAPRSAMLCLMTDAPGADTSYYSTDDSYIAHCRFATNSVNSSYALAISSSDVQVSHCIFFAANGCLIGHGGQPTFHQCAFEVYGYQAIDATHNHACIKYHPNYGYGFVTITDCYSESGYNGATPTTAILAYFVQYTGGGTLDFKPRVNLLVNGGFWSMAIDANHIEIGGGNRGHIRLINPLWQGDNQPKIYAPDCSVYVETFSDVTSASSDNYHTWQMLTPASCLNWTHKFSTPDSVLVGEDLADVTVTVGSTNYPAQLKFTSIDEALTWVNSSSANVTLELQQNDTIANAINLRGNLTINLNSHTLTFSSIVQNFGTLTINGAGTAISTGRKLYNYGNLTLVTCTINALVSSLGGVTFATGCTFDGTDDSISCVGQESRVVIDHGSSTYSGSEYVVSLAANVGVAVLNAQNGTTPTTGKFARGTQFRNILPSSGAPTLWYATSNGVGALANWKHQGNLS